MRDSAVAVAMATALYVRMMIALVPSTPCQVVTFSLYALSDGASCDAHLGIAVWPAADAAIISEGDENDRMAWRDVLNGAQSSCYS